MQPIDHHELFRQQWVLAQPRIYAYIRTVVFHRSDAEDLLQEVAELLWERIDDFEPGTRFDQWAIAVTRNKILNFQKKKARERVKFSDSIEELLVDEAVAEMDRGGELADALEGCVGKLSLVDRELLQARYQPAATNRSVAATRGKSESTVSRNLNKIYRQLLKCIELATGSDNATGRSQ